MAIFFTMNVMVFTLVLWTWNLHNISPDPRIQVFQSILRYACLLFSGPVLVLLGGPLLESCVEACRQKRFTTDWLLLIGVFASFGYSVMALILDSPEVYFEVCCMILVAVTLGKWLEGTAKQKATSAIRSLRDLLPTTVRVLSPSGERIVATEQVSVGDQLRILPGDRIPLDGQVCSELAIVDEQFITGESIPVSKQTDDMVFAGSLNLSHELTITVSRPADEGTIAAIVRAVENAATTDCRSIRLADTLSAWFVPFIGVAAAATFVRFYDQGVQHALMAATSVVLIACPCALGIATPMAIWVAINSAARRGVLFRSGDAILRLASLRSLGLDKTGTLTTGELHIASVSTLEGVEVNTFQNIAKRLAGGSNHPLSKAISQQVEPIQMTDDLVIADLQDHAGRGVTGKLAIDGSWAVAMLGSEEFARELDMRIPAGLHSTDADGSVRESALVYVGWHGEIKGVYYLADQIRPESQEALDQLRQLDLSLMILTGDTVQRASAVERATGVTAIGALLPDEKRRILRELPAPVGMVGDGLNDAISLAGADIGISLESGADVSRECSDVCLLGTGLKHLPWALAFSRATRKTIRRNLFWAVGYNAIGVGFAVTGNLNPIVAAFAMIGSSLFVLSNCLALGFSAERQDHPSPQPNRGEMLTMQSTVDHDRKRSTLSPEAEPDVELEPIS